jgi:hypothetical protein
MANSNRVLSNVHISQLEIERFKASQTGAPVDNDERPVSDARRASPECVQQTPDLLASEDFGRIFLAASHYCSGLLLTL